MRRGILSFTLSLMLGLTSLPAAAAERVLLTAGAIAAGETAGAPGFSALRRAASAKGSISVIVGLKVPFAAEGALPPAEAQRQRAEISGTAAALATRLGRTGREAASFRSFTTIPFATMNVTPAELDRLAKDPAVLSISENIRLEAALAASVPLIQGNEAWVAGYSGAGQTIAIIDTGVDKDHPFLKGKVVSEACYSTGGACPGATTASTAEGAGRPCSFNGCTHGTHVAGIAAGKGASFSGVARDAQLIAIQVFSPPLAGEAKGYAAGSDVIAALERVYALRNDFSIASANLSLGGLQFASTCDAANPAFTTVVRNLKSAGIATVASSGNDSATAATTFPACISDVVSVGAVSTRDWGICPKSPGGSTAQDKVLCYSNSASFLSLLAPGAPITSSVPGGGFATLDGTSMAAPHVAGAFAVLKQKAPTASVAALLSALQSSGKRVTDHRNGLTKSRIAVKPALDRLQGVQVFTLSYVKAGSAPGTVSFQPAAANAACSANCTNSYTAGTVVTLTAVAGEGASFAGWSGACSGTGKCSLAMSAMRQVTATFTTPGTPPPFTLTYTKAGLGAGRVSFVPAGEMASCSDSCTNLFQGGTTVSLTATPGPFVSFQGWTGACRGSGSCVVSLAGAGRAVTATFTPLATRALAYTKAGEGNGVVSFSPGGSLGSCSSSCTNTFVAGNTVTLTARADAGSRFTGWSGGCSGNTPACTVSMKSAQSVTATFRRP